MKSKFLMLAIAAMMMSGQVLNATHFPLVQVGTVGIVENGANPDQDLIRQFGQSSNIVFYTVSQGRDALHGATQGRRADFQGLGYAGLSKNYQGCELIIDMMNYGGQLEQLDDNTLNKLYDITIVGKLSKQHLQDILTDIRGNVARKVRYDTLIHCLTERGIVNFLASELRDPKRDINAIVNDIWSADTANN